MNNFKEYWDKRFRSEGKIWGDQPSQSALIALKYFETRNIKSILVPGSGYGRNTKLFSENSIKNSFFFVHTKKRRIIIYICMAFPSFFEPFLTPYRLISL